MTTRIDDLPSTVLTSREHEFPAMKDGLTVKLAVGQVMDLVKAELLDGAPEALDTLNEIAAAINDDADIYGTLVQQISQATPSGCVAMFPSLATPVGWLKANGAEVSRTTYANLFAVIGESFGAGDGSTTFNLPDFRGSFLRSYDDGAGVDAGRAINSLQEDAFQGHNIEVRSNTNGDNSKVCNEPGDLGASGVAQGKDSTETPYYPLADTIVSDGVNGTPRIASETRPVNYALSCCIKY